MSANFEVEIRSTHYVPISRIQKIFHVFHSGITFRQITAYSNWAMDRADEHQISDVEIQEFVQAGKIVRAACDLEKGHAGVLSFFEKGLFVSALWINTGPFPELDADWITANNAKYYQTLTRQLCEDRGLSIAVAALGCEIVVEYRESVQEMCRRSYNVVQWILGPAMHAERIEGYSKTAQLADMQIFVKA